MSLTDAPGGPQDPAVLKHPAAGIPADELHDLLADLAARYGQYRLALSGPFDPVMTLALTGEVLQAVRNILTATGQALGQCHGIRAIAGQ